MTNHERKIQEQLAIPVHLLDGVTRKRPWSNLGDWSHATEYSAACEALACRIGQAAGLSSDDKLLDMACGHGASLSIWTDVFGVKVVDGIERQAQALASIEADRPPALRHLWQADVNSIIAKDKPWPQDEHYDAIVVVDAAYHFHSLRAFLEQSGSRLRPGGRIAFTTLMLGAPWLAAAGWKKQLVFRLAAGALIPAQSLVSEKEVNDSFFAAGFGPPVCERLDRDVLRGFVQFVEKRRNELNWKERATAGWWKVEATATAARQILRTGLLHYVLLKAVKL